MSKIPGLRRVFRLAMGRTGVDKDVEEEISFHLEARKEELFGRGWRPRKPQRWPRRSSGMWGSTGLRCAPWVVADPPRERRADLTDAFRKDLSFALRQLWRNKGFTLAAALTLALGVGATTAIFSVVNGVLLKPLPYPDPDRLVTVQKILQHRWHDLATPFPSPTSWTFRIRPHL